MENLQNRIDGLEWKTERLARLCKFVGIPENLYNIPQNDYGKVTLSAIMDLIAEEAERIEEETTAIFGDKRMIEFYNSLGGEVETTIYNARKR